MGGILLLVVAAAVVYFVYKRNANWRTLMARSGDEAREVEARYAYLESNNVKCRLRSEAPANLGAVQTAASAVDWNRNELVKLQVHSKDLERAESLLERFDQEQPAASV